MTIIPWKRMHKVPVTREPFPVSSFDLRPELDRLIGRWLPEPWFGARHETDMLMPALDISETETHIRVRVEMPGVEPDAVDISVCGSVLTVSGEKSESTDETVEDFYHCERRFGSFRRSVELPDSADLDKIEATDTNGVLTIMIAKMPAASPRHIEVKTTKKTPVKPRAHVDAV